MKNPLKFLEDPSDVPLEGIPGELRAPHMGEDDLEQLEERVRAHMQAMIKKMLDEKGHLDQV